MSAKLEYTRKEMRVYLDGEIDHHSASLIRAGIDDAIILRRPELLILNFDDVSFMDSSAIGLVMGRYKLMKTHEGKIRVEGLSPSSYRVMKLAGIERLGEIRVKETV